MCHKTEIFICIGSNEPDATARVSRAIDKLRECVSIAAIAGPYPTLPMPPADPDGPVYANAVVKAYTCLGREHIRAMLKNIETLGGRLATHKSTGRVVIDLDLVVYGNDICRRSEFEATYFRTGYDRLTEQ